MPDPLTLLLVEDEPLVALALQHLLEDAGYRVLLASSGAEGAVALDRHSHEIAGLITDIRLGAGPDGWSLAAQARALRPMLPVLYVSGDSAHQWAFRGVGGSVMLAKPFSAPSILEALADMLGSGCRA